MNIHHFTDLFHHQSVLLNLKTEPFILLHHNQQSALFNLKTEIYHSICKKKKLNSTSHNSLKITHVSNWIENLIMYLTNSHLERISLLPQRQPLIIHRNILGRF